tara:strand:- start:108 stop:290 length:183 start_codon:yes stop_codon:yes gene_type:complete
MFVGHKPRTKEETKKMLRLTKRLDERKKKEEQDQRDMKWLTTVRDWVYPERENNNENSGV